MCKTRGGGGGGGEIPYEETVKIKIVNYDFGLTPSASG